MIKRQIILARDLDHAIQSGVNVSGASIQLNLHHYKALLGNRFVNRTTAGRATIGF